MYAHRQSSHFEKKNGNGVGGLTLYFSFRFLTSDFDRNSLAVRKFFYNKQKESGTVILKIVILMIHCTQKTRSRMAMFVCECVCVSRHTQGGGGPGVWRRGERAEMKQCLRTVLFHGNNIVVFGSDV